MQPTHGGRLSGDIFEECAGWIWEQLQEQGYFLSGELIELLLVLEREMGIHTRDTVEIAPALFDELVRRGIVSVPAPISQTHVAEVLFWEDEFLSMARISRAES